MLTRLPNRRFLDTRLPEILAAAAKANRRVGIGFLDLDNFKQINDTLGHSIGDALLSKTAERIAKSLRKNDLVLRVGGDEFVIILEERRDDVENRLQRIRAAVSQPLRIGNYDIKVTCSIGMAFSRSMGKPRRKSSRRPISPCMKPNIPGATALPPSPRTWRMI